MMKKIVLIFLVLSFVNVVAQENWSTAASEIYQQQLNIDFQDPNESPLTDADFKTFQGLDFYPIQSKYIVEAECVNWKSKRHSK